MHERKAWKSVDAIDKPIVVAQMVRSPVRSQNEPLPSPSDEISETVYLADESHPAALEELDPALRIEVSGLNTVVGCERDEVFVGELPSNSCDLLQTPDQKIGEDTLPPAKSVLSLVSKKRFWFVAAPSWLISLLVHVAVIVFLAAIHMQPVTKILSVLTAERGDSATEGLQEFDVSATKAAEPAAEEAVSAATSLPEQSDVIPEVANLQISEFGNLRADNSIKNLIEQIVPSSSLMNSESIQLMSSLSSRSKQSKGMLLERYGGSAASEKAVSMGLKWLAEHQGRNGGWTFAHSAVCRGQCKDDGRLATATNAATALALLPFLGAGQTHLDGEYQPTVRRGLEFLIRKMKVTSGAHPAGSWHEEGGSMYSHGLAAITICEAYAMTRDSDLLQPAQLALNYIVDSQDPRGGGWRYAPKQPGDTSVVGWQLMALKSGAMGNLVIPQRTIRMAESFLNSVSMNKGAYYGYDRPTTKIEGRAATTSVGLLCRMYLGTPKTDPGIAEGVKFLSARGPQISDLYYTYYATQVMRHYGGAAWDKWNTALRDQLIKAQVKDGHAAGSWLTHVAGRGGHQDKGGRLYCTSLATMILEVYYRHMPLYSEKSSNEDFEL